MQAPLTPHSSSCHRAHVVSKIVPNTIGPGTNTVNHTRHIQIKLLTLHLLRKLEISIINKR